MKDKLSRPYSLEKMRDTARKVSKVYFNPYTGKKMNFKNPRQMNGLIKKLIEQIENSREFCLKTIEGDLFYLNGIRKREIRLLTIWALLVSAFLLLNVLKKFL